MNLFCVWGIYNFCHKRMVTNLLVDLTLLTYTVIFFIKSPLNMSYLIYLEETYDLNFSKCSCQG